MAHFNTFLEIFTTLLFCISLSMVFAILAQVIYKYLKRWKTRRLRALIFHKRLESDLENSQASLKKLQGDFKLAIQECKHLKLENEAFRRELPIYTELRAEMMSYSVRLESENLFLNRELDVLQEEIRILESELDIDLELDPSDVYGAKGVDFEELGKLPSIMQGTNEIADIEAAVIVAKASGTNLFEQMKGQIKDSQVHIGSLIDHIDKRLSSPSVETQNAETYFYNQTGFSIRDLLPTKTA